MTPDRELNFACLALLNRILVALLCFVVLTPPALAQKYFADNGYAEFESRAPALTFKGVSNNLTGLLNLGDGTVDFYLDLNTLDTGINLRNRHMRDSYLETAKYPFAEFRGMFGRATSDPGSEPGSVSDLADGESAEVTASGQFTIHGVTRKIRAHGTIQKSGTEIHLRASFSVELSDYNIDRPRVVFYELSETQRISIDIRMEQYDDP